MSLKHAESHAIYNYRAKETANWADVRAVSRPDDYSDDWDDPDALAVRHACRHDSDDGVAVAVAASDDDAWNGAAT